MEEKNVQKLLQFIAESPTCYHAVDAIRRELGEYALLNEGEKQIKINIDIRY